VSADLIEGIARKVNVSNDIVVDALPDDLLANARSLPQLDSPRQLLNRLRGKEFETVIAGAVLLSNPDDQDLVLYCVNILLGQFRHGVVKEYLSRCTADQIRPLIEQHREVLVDYLSSDKDLLRSDWSVQLIDLLAPRGGWGSITYSHLTVAAMNLLRDLIGEDRRVWEAALVLYEGWTGTLDDLVNASRTI
jgi:hypothetical protein